MSILQAAALALLVIVVLFIIIPTAVRLSARAWFEEKLHYINRIISKSNDTPSQGE